MDLVCCCYLRKYKFIFHIRENKLSQNVNLVWLKSYATNKILFWIAEIMSDTAIILLTKKAIINSYHYIPNITHLLNAFPLNIDVSLFDLSELSRPTRAVLSGQLICKHNIVPHGKHNSRVLHSRLVWNSFIWKYPYLVVLILKATKLNYYFKTLQNIGSALMFCFSRLSGEYWKPSNDNRVINGYSTGIKNCCNIL